MMAGFQSFLFVVLLILFANPAVSLANNEFFEQRYRGWLWFDEEERLSDTKETNKKTKDKQDQEQKMPSKEEMLEAKRANEKFAEELDLLKHLMINQPHNLHYIKLYKEKEKELFDNAILLGSNWPVVNFLNPDLVDELKHPQNVYGRSIYKKEELKNRAKMINGLRDKVELYVFREESCPYCHELEEHLKNFNIKYDFKIEAISRDKSQSKYFKTHQSPELVKVLNLEVMPAVIARVKDSGQRFELARGTVSVSELEEKAMLLAQYLLKQDTQEVDKNEKHNEKQIAEKSDE